jgi:hypothetical protein
MSGHAERGRRGAPPRGRRPELDRTWLGRIALAVIVAAVLALVARVSMMAFSGGGTRTERYERSAAREHGAPLARETGALP